VIRALAVLAVAVSAVALFVGLILTAFVLSLGLRAKSGPDSHKNTTDV
jgi:hypothetical protein